MWLIGPCPLSINANYSFVLARQHNLTINVKPFFGNDSMIIFLLHILILKKDFHMIENTCLHISTVQLNNEINILKGQKDKPLFYQKPF